jgi:hypothetical protein
MRKILITESEKKRIINLHNRKINKFYLKEGNGCLCADGSVSESCCKPTSAPTKTEVTDEEKQEILLKAEILKRKEDELKNQQIEQEKKTKIESIQKQLDQTYNDILSKPKMDKYQQKIFDDRIKLLQNELSGLKGIPNSSSNEPQKRSADQKVSAWVSVASSMLALFTTLSNSFKKQQ